MLDPLSLLFLLCCLRDLSQLIWPEVEGDAERNYHTVEEKENRVKCLIILRSEGL